MPKLAERSVPTHNEAEPVMPSVQHIVAPANDNAPTYNPLLRCPLPSISAFPDDLRQFYRGSVPQTRLIPLVSTQ